MKNQNNIVKAVYNADLEAQESSELIVNSSESHARRHLNPVKSESQQVSAELLDRFKTKLEAIKAS